MKDTQKRLTELKQEGAKPGGVADPAHTTVMNLVSDDEEYSGGEAFQDLDDSNGTVSSRYFSNQQKTTRESSEEYHVAVSEQSGPKSRKGQTNKRQRPKNSFGLGFKGKGSKSKSTKSKDGTDNNRAPPSRKGSKAKPSAPRIPMMPV